MSAVGAGSRASRVTLREARPEDCRTVWTWRNDPETRQASFDSEVIPFETHEAWFRESLGARDRKLFVVVAEGVDAGVARLDLVRNRAEVSIHLAPEWRRRGVGVAALRALADLALGAGSLTAVVARVKADNYPSLAVFHKAGFTVTDGGDIITLTRTRDER